MTFNIQRKYKKMKIIKLGAGVHTLEEVTEPTHIISTAEYQWDCVIAPSNHDQPTISYRAPLRITGCDLRGGKSSIKGHGSDPAPLEIDNCWLHHARMTGVYAEGSLRIHRSLIEYCGGSSHWGQGVYFNPSDAEQLWISNSIIRHNSAYQISCLGQGLIEQSLILGMHSVFTNQSPSTTTLRRNTIKGLLGRVIADESNIIVEDADTELRYWAMHGGIPGVSDVGKQLFWLSERAKAWDGQGCYDYHDFGPDPTNIVGLAHAKTLWHGGYMEAAGDSWRGKPGMVNPYPYPHFPGDEMPS